MMIAKLIKNLRPKKTSKKVTYSIISRDNHNISRKDISSAALKTLYKLHEAGFQAFLVGGSVRDLLLNLHPKDFDVSTNATPEDVKRLFGAQCMLIGRRFRLAHVRFGREIVEVSTFRAPHDDSQHAQQNHQGLIVRDNVWGDIEQDAARRDFTINCLYYNIADFSVWEFSKALQDIKNKTIRVLGDPETRYREDPVRILRAIRFAAKLDFSIEPESAAAISQTAKLITQVSHHRLFDECQKLLNGGQAERVLDLLDRYELTHILFPSAPQKAEGQRLIRLTARNTDARIQIQKGVNPAFFYAALLWESVCNHLQQLTTESIPLMPALQQAGQRALQEQHQRTAFTKVASQTIREIWEMQPRLTQPRPRQLEQLLQSPRFRAAYDFLVLREEAGENTQGWGQWWTRYQSADPGLKAEMMRDLTKGVTPSAKPKKPKVKKVDPI